MKAFLTILTFLAFSFSTNAQTIISGTLTGSPATGIETKQGYIGIGAELDTTIKGRFQIIQRASFNKEYKAYLPDDLEGVSQRFTTLTRWHITKKNNTSFFVTPFALNLRHVRYNGAGGYRKRGYNWGIGGGVTHKFTSQLSSDISAIYYFPDWYKWEFSTGKGLGNASRGFVIEHNTNYQKNRWQYGYSVQVNRFKSIQPYDPEPRPFYTSNSVVLGFRIRRQLGK